MKWRLALFALIALGFASIAGAQANKIPVIGVLMITVGPEDRIVQALRTGLRERGYTEGKDYRFEHRSAQGHAERIPQLARELVDMKVAVIVTGVEPVVRAIKDLTDTIPVVMILSDSDPVASGLVASLRRPGGNVTGVATQIPELAGKRLQILKEVMPNLPRVAVLLDKFSRGQVTELEPAAKALGVELQVIELTAAYDFDAAFTQAQARKCPAAMMLFSPHFYVRRVEIEKQGLKHKMPTMHFDDSIVKDGGLISYGPSTTDMWTRGAYYIDRLLKGAKPQDLPIEQEARVKLVVNQQTANALGIKIPESILLRADEVIR